MSENVNVTADLLSSAKNYLDITWEDDATDEKLQGIIDRGKSYLDGIHGPALDYAEETAARALLFDYCRYVLADALQDFANDFQPELLRLHIEGEVEQESADEQAGSDV